MSTPTEKQLARMHWGFKLVGTDLCTDDHNGGRFRYRLGEWNKPFINGVASESQFSVGRECPMFPGDGLCVAHDLSAATSGGARVGSSVMLIVGYLADDVLGGKAGTGKVRVRRLYVDPDPVDPVRLIVWAAATGADLSGAVLRSADLSGAVLSGADLSGAVLSGADLRSADLSGAVLSGAVLSGAVLSGAVLRSADLSGAVLRSAVLSGADLSGAVGNSWTRLPAGWKVSDSGLVVPS